MATFFFACVDILLASIGALSVAQSILYAAVKKGKLSRSTAGFLWILTGILTAAFLMLRLVLLIEHGQLLLYP